MSWQIGSDNFLPTIYNTSKSFFLVRPNSHVNMLYFICFSQFLKLHKSLYWTENLTYWTDFLIMLPSSKMHPNNRAEFKDGEVRTSLPHSDHLIWVKSWSRTRSLFLEFQVDIRNNLEFLYVSQAILLCFLFFFWVHHSVFNNIFYQIYVNQNIIQPLFRLLTQLKFWNTNSI